MKRLCATIAILLLSGGLALAQNVGGATGRSNQNTFAAPRTTVGVPPPSVNPGNPQDLTNRGNPQNMTLPGASNPQDLIR
jgi:hypothetical protein